MAGKYLSREDAPISGQTWEILEAAMTDAARRVLAGRRLFHIEGPYGLGLRAVPLKSSREQSGFTTSPVIPLVLIEKTFTLSKWDIAAFEESGVALDTTEIYRTASECAMLEDSLIFKGASKKAGLIGMDGPLSLNLTSWEAVGKPSEELVTAMTLLDEAGFHGPYSLVLTPARYNLLFRPYQMTAVMELEHVRVMASEGVAKAPILDGGGVLGASGRQYATIVLGQDMNVGFVGPEEDDQLRFFISETVALRVFEPKAICILRE